LLEQDFDVTVISTIQVTVGGVLAISKLLSLVEEDLLWEKNGVVLASSRAFTSIVTPEEGKVEVIETFKLKGPTEGSSVVPMAGVVATVRVGSLEQLSVLLLQESRKN
jgi:hypothetical protein